MGIYNKVGQECMNAISRRAACWGEDATKSLVPFQGSALCGGADVAERGAWRNGGPFGVALFFVFLSFAVYPFM